MVEVSQVGKGKVGGYNDALERFVAGLVARSTKSCAAMLAYPGIHIKVSWVDWDWRERRMMWMRWEIG